jgi:GTP-binding protein
MTYSPMFEAQECVRLLASATETGAKSLYGGFSRALSTTSRVYSRPGPATTTPEHIDLSPSTLSYHWSTSPPRLEQLRYADDFFSRGTPKFLWSAPKFATMSFGDSPEVAFLGRSNVGKSSLLNALLGRKIAHTSSKPGRTREMNAFSVGNESDNGKNRLVVLDMPGYGKGGRAEWGSEILKYLEKRKQLKRAFLLIETVHGIKESDAQLLALFRERDIPHQIILAKVDRLLFPNARLPSKGALEARLTELRGTMEDVRNALELETHDGAGAQPEVLACSSEKKINGKLLGINAVRHAMLQAAGLELQSLQASSAEVVPFDQIKWKHE